MRLNVALVAVFLALTVTAGVAGAQVFPPEAKSEQGDDIRALYMIVFVVAAVVFVAVEAAIIYIVLRYRRRGDALPKQTHGNQLVEVIWTATPAAIVITLFVVTFMVLDDIESSPPEDERVETVDVLGRQWTWAFRYSERLDVTVAEAVAEGAVSSVLTVSDAGAFQGLAPFSTVIRLDVEHMRVTAIDGGAITVDRAVDGTVAEQHDAGTPIDLIFDGTETAVEPGRLDSLVSVDPATGEEVIRPTPIVTVPTDITVRFNLASHDVIHSFYTPQFLYKLDVVPGRVQSMWINVTEAGLYEGQCAEFCGRDHARMIFTVRALEPDEYEAWRLERLAAALGAAPPPVTEEEAAASGMAAEAAGGPVRGDPALTLEEEIRQYRNPRDQMPAFPADSVPDRDVADIHAWLRTLE